MLFLLILEIILINIIHDLTFKKEDSVGPKSEVLLYHVVCS